MPRYIAFAITILLAIGVGAWLLRDRPTAVPGPVDAVAGPPSTGTTASAPVAAPPTHPVAAPPLQSPTPDFAADTTASAREADASMAKLEKRWSADQLASAADLGIERNLTGIAASPRVLQAHEQPARIEEISCRSTMCRVETSFPAGSSASEWSTRMLIEMGGVFGSSSLVTVPGRNGENRVIVYAFKKGVPPPR